MQSSSRCNGEFSERKLSLVVLFHMEINILLFYSFLMTLKLLQKQIISFYGMKKQKFGAHAKTEGGEDSTSE